MKDLEQLIRGKGSACLYLTKELRNRLFSRAYTASGCSLRKIADSLGFVGEGRNGPIRDMWLGRRSISRKHIETLANLAKIDLTEIIANTVAKQDNEEQEDWHQPHGTRL